MKFSIKDLFSKFDQICRILWILFRAVCVFLDLQTIAKIIQTGASCISALATYQW